ncbi:MAG: peptidyl-prolyl cis-trans isomerase [Methanobacteriota archaeon]|nr:MAG: peptidyl-prolyl cis-trans isomerase [Euryarchaeota archaeon]
MTKKVNAAHILLKDESKANELLAMAKSGQDFAALARTHSECPSARNGGSLGWFSRGQMVKEFENAAFSGSKGDIVGPVRTQFGWHLIKIVDLK